MKPDFLPMPSDIRFADYVTRVLQNLEEKLTVDVEETLEKRSLGLGKVLRSYLEQGPTPIIQLPPSGFEECVIGSEDAQYKHGWLAWQAIHDEVKASLADIELLWTNKVKANLNVKVKRADIVDSKFFHILLKSSLLRDMEYEDEVLKGDEILAECKRITNALSSLIESPAESSGVDLSSWSQELIAILNWRPWGRRSWFTLASPPSLPHLSKPYFP